MTGERASMDRLLKRAEIARRQADDLPPSAPLRERLCVIVDLRQSLKALEQRHAELEKRRAAVLHGRSAIAAYGQAAALRLSPR